MEALLRADSSGESRNNGLVDVTVKKSCACPFVSAAIERSLIGQAADMLSQR